MTPSNYEIALKAEMKRVVRCYQAYTPEQRSNHDTLKLGIRQRKTFGEFYYVHPALPDRAFPTRKRAALAGMARQDICASGRCWSGACSVLGYCRQRLSASHL